MRLFCFIAIILSSALAAGQQDSLLSSVIWEETTPGERQGFLLRLEPYGPFEEDAGANHQRKSRYLMGQWTLDTAKNTLTLSVDYFMGKSLVPSRYREGRDFYLRYNIIERTAEQLVLQDERSGEERTFRARPIADKLDAAERRAKKIELGQKKRTKLKLPGGINQ